MPSSSKLETSANDREAETMRFRGGSHHEKKKERERECMLTFFAPSAVAAAPSAAPVVEAPLVGATLVGTTSSS